MTNNEIMLNFDTYKNAGLISPLEAQRMQPFSQQIDLIRALDTSTETGNFSFADTTPSTPFQTQTPTSALSPQTPSSNPQLNQLLSLISQQPQEYVDIFLKLFSNLHVERELRYLMEMFLGLCEGVEEFRVALRQKLASQASEDQDSTTNQAQIDDHAAKHSQYELYDAFLRHLGKPSLAPLVYKSLTILFRFQLQDNAEIPKEPLQQFISSISNAISNQKLDLEDFSESVSSLSASPTISHAATPVPHSKSPLSVLVHALMEILKYAPARPIFHEARGIPHLVNLLKPPYGDIQLVYEVCFCIWVLSFTEDVVQYFQHENIIPKLHDVLRNVKKEKVVRIVLSTFKNLIAYPSFVSNMIRVSVPKTLISLRKRNFEDKDIESLLSDIFEKIEEQIDELSSFDEYRQEVLSGHLVWSPVHTSQKFWKENLKKLEEDDYRMLRALAKILENAKTQSPLNLSIACHDLGMFVQFHPRGKKIVAQLGAKHNIIMLCEHTDTQVKKHALSTTQKLLLSSALW